MADDDGKERDQLLKKAGDDASYGDPEAAEGKVQPPQYDPTPSSEGSETVSHFGSCSVRSLSPPLRRTVNGRRSFDPIGVCVCRRVPARIGRTRYSSSSIASFSPDCWQLSTMRRTSKLLHRPRLARPTSTLRPRLVLSVRCVVHVSQWGAVYSCLDAGIRHRNHTRHPVDHGPALHRTCDKNDHARTWIHESLLLLVSDSHSSKHRAHDCNDGNHSPRALRQGMPSESAAVA